jgi:hypothetical protein
VNAYAVVVTTINRPTPAVLALNSGSAALDARFVVIGDSKSPPDFTLEGAHYLDLAAQRETGFRFAAICPERHYARKNIGYLVAAAAGATVIIETDDDNLPEDGFWAPRERMVRAPLVTEPGWCNVYSYFSDEMIWPRGLPLDRVKAVPPPLGAPGGALLDCPIQQGLAQDNPDVDALYRLLLKLPVRFRDGRVVLGKGVWCPFNSQNTTTWQEAFPLLYLPYHCSFRMTDIWRSFIAQRIGWENGWNVLFHDATVVQDRNEHDLMRDFAEEVPGYLHNERIRRLLEDLPLDGGTHALGDNLRRCYRALIEAELIGVEEEPLLDAWLHDLAQLG